jgi:hypothetical protein
MLLLGQWGGLGDWDKGAVLGSRVTCPHVRLPLPA